jgi:hypothetical protein
MDQVLAAELIRKFRPEVIRNDAEAYTPLNHIQMRTPGLLRRWNDEAEANQDPPFEVPEGTNPEALIRAIRESRTYKGYL